MHRNLTRRMTGRYATLEMGSMGNVIEVDAKGLNTTSTIESNDFNVQVSEIDLDEIERIKGRDYECGDCSKS